MRLLSTLLRATAVAAIVAAGATAVTAKDVTISVSAGGTGPNDTYRVDAIDIAADILEREAAIRVGRVLEVSADQRELGVARACVDEGVE